MLIRKPDEFTRCCLRPSNTVKALTLPSVAGWDIIRRSVVHREYEVAADSTTTSMFTFPDFISMFIHRFRRTFIHFSRSIEIIVYESKPCDIMPRENQNCKSSKLVLRIRTCAHLVVLDPGVAVIETSKCTYGIIS